MLRSLCAVENNVPLGMPLIPKCAEKADGIMGVMSVPFWKNVILGCGSPLQSKSI